jgi:two-component system sensor histidine kinase HydH
LASLELLDRQRSGRALEPMWDGRELYRTEPGQDIFRAWVPVHTAAGLRIARIDLAAASADFLVEHARQNIIAACIAGFVLVGLSAYAVWATRRTARMEHLAHIGELSAVLAHEIRNPLGTIKGFAQLLDERAQPADRQLIAPILSETTRLEELVKDLLAYGRPPQVKVRDVEWSAIEASLRAHALNLIGQRPIAFVTSGREMRLLTDPALLEQGLLNLVRNAVEAIPADRPGEVRLDIETSRGLTITVRDDGCGVSADARRRLFMPFQTTKASGTGLGLPVTRKLARSLGGDLTLEPNHPRGAVARMNLPVKLIAHGTHSRS